MAKRWDLDDTVDVVKSVVKKVGTESAMAAIVAAAPFLAPFKFILSWLIGKIVGFIIDETEVGLFIWRINELTEEQAETFKKSYAKLYEIPLDTPKEERDRLELEAIEAARKLIKLTS